jgi:MFS family permease
MRNRKDEVPLLGDSRIKQNVKLYTAPFGEKIQQQFISTNGTTSASSSTASTVDTLLSSGTNQEEELEEQKAMEEDGFGEDSTIIEEEEFKRNQCCNITPTIQSERQEKTTYKTMMHLSEPKNPLRFHVVRYCAIWLVTSCILFLTNQLTTLPVGFFPSYAEDVLGMTSTQLSVFFSVYPLCIMLSSPLAASLSPIVGRQTIMCMGLVFSGSTTVAFAYVSSVAMVFFLRIVQGLGAGAAVVGSISMITEEFSNSVGQVLVVQEFVVAAAFITAPPIGSALYELNGFELPFLVCGVGQLLLVVIVPFLFIEYGLPDGLYSHGPLRSSFYPLKNGNVSYREVLTPTCSLCLVLTAFSMSAFGFIDPFLGSHMQRVLGAQHVAIGFGFGLSALVYFLGGVIYVWLTRKCGCKQVIIFGLLELAVGFFFLGPPPFLTNYFQDYNVLWTTQWVALILIGCGAALSIAPGLPLSLLSVSNLGSQAFNLVIGLFAAAIYLGQAIGPFFALFLMKTLPKTHSLHCFADKEIPSRSCESSLPWAFTVYSFITMILLGIVVVKLSTGDAIITFLLQHKHCSLSRQTSEYGQFIFLDDEEDFVDDVTFHSVPK